MAGANHFQVQTSHMTAIPIHWAFNCRGNWDHGMMMLAEERLLAPKDESPVFYNIFGPEEGSVICFLGGTAVNPEVREFLSGLRNCLVISLSDEEAKFRPEMVHPSNVVWVQYGQPGKHDAAAKWILTGMRYDTPEVVRSQESVARSQPRFLWSFVGQCQNRTRQEMMAAVIKRKDGFFGMSNGFGGHSGGMAYPEYIQTMLRSDFVLCPAGNVVADSFRFAEALECGAIPVVNPRGEQEPTGFDYWVRVFGMAHLGLPVCDLNAWLDHPDAYGELYSRKQQRLCADFWHSYKRQFVQDIVDTVAKLK